ncbi:MAG TPA: DUF4350 domain-containing protein, partial [Polyangiaceae bacterium]
GAAMWLIWIAIAVVLAFVIRRLTFRSKLWKVQKPEVVPGDDPASASVGEERQVDTETASLLAQARRAAGEGRFGDGITKAYAALLRQLEQDGVIRLHPSRTNGDYLRDLRPRAALHDSVRPIVRAVEHAQFGEAMPSSQEFDAIFRGVTTLVTSRPASKWLGPGLASTLMLVALSMVSFTSCKLPWGIGSIDDEPSGKRVLFELLKQRGFEPHMRLRPPKQGSDADQILVLPGASIDDGRWQDLIDWTERGGTLIVGRQSHKLTDWLNVKIGEKGAFAQLTAGDFIPNREQKVVVPATHHLLIEDETPSWGPMLLEGSDIYAAEFDRGDGKALVFADELLFTNMGLALADNADFVVSLLDPAKKHVDLIADSMGAGSPNPMTSVERGKLAPSLLQFFALLLLLYFNKGFPFGTLVDPPADRRKAFALHVQALGTLYAKAAAAAHARSIYAAFALERLRIGSWGEPKGARALADSVAARARLPIAEVAAVLEEAERAKDHVVAPDAPPTDLALVRKLSRILRKINGGTA